MKYTEITSWEIAAKFMGIDPKALPEVSAIREDLGAYVIAHYKSAIIIEALNKAFKPKEKTKWIPDWFDGKLKYFIWWWFKQDAASPSGVGLSVSVCDYSDSRSYVGSRRTFRDSDLVEHYTKHFEALEADLMLM